MAEARQASNAWKVLTVLFLANLFNFFDRAVPAIVIEPIRMEWGLSDLQIGIISAAFTVVYAIAGIPLGRLADTGSRKKIMGWGLIVWSGFTALGAGSWSFASFLFTRIGVGIGEASYAPAANSLIGDMFPANKRSRAVGVFMLGLPLGLLLAFFTVGAMVKALRFLARAIRDRHDPGADYRRADVQNPRAGARRGRNDPVHASAGRQPDRAKCSAFRPCGGSSWAESPPISQPMRPTASWCR